MKNPLDLRGTSQVRSGRKTPRVIPSWQVEKLSVAREKNASRETSLEPESFRVRKKQRSDLATAPLAKNFNFWLFKVLENAFREFFFYFYFLLSFVSEYIESYFVVSSLEETFLLKKKIKLRIIRIEPTID